MNRGGIGVEAGLHTIRAGMRAVVMQMQDSPGITKRLWQMGIKPGTVVYCCYRSPGGRVVVLEFRDRKMALSTKDLRKVRVALSMYF